MAFYLEQMLLCCAKVTKILVYYLTNVILKNI